MRMHGTLSSRENCADCGKPTDPEALCGCFCYVWDEATNAMHIAADVCYHCETCGKSYPTQGFGSCSRPCTSCGHDAYTRGQEDRARVDHERERRQSGLYGMEVWGSCWSDSWINRQDGQTAVCRAGPETWLGRCRSLA